MPRAGPGGRVSAGRGLPRAVRRPAASSASSRPRTSRARSVSSAARAPASRRAVSAAPASGREVRARVASRSCRRGVRWAPRDCGLGGEQGAQRRRDSRIRERVGAVRPSARARSAGPVSWYVHRAGQVEDEGVGLLVDEGLQRLVQRDGDGAGVGAPAREGVGGGEGGQRAAAAGGGEGGHGHVAGLLAAQPVSSGLDLAEHGDDGYQQPRRRGPRSTRRSAAGSDGPRPGGEGSGERGVGRAGRRRRSRGRGCS